MFAPKNILVATDFGEAALRALRYGAEFARAFGARLHVLHVADDLALHAVVDTPAGVPTIDFASMQVALEEAARGDLRALIRSVDLRGLNLLPSVIRDAQPSRAIVGYARAQQVDLVVIGTHGRNRLADFFLGSVAQRVVRNAECPVLTVRANEREFVESNAPASARGRITGSV